MNANELAYSISRFVEEIKKTNNPSDDTVIKGLPVWIVEDLENSATMLRQQQAEIEALKAKLNADKFCDANCLWTDHHPDCQIGKAQEK